MFGVLLLGVSTLCPYMVSCDSLAHVDKPCMHVTDVHVVSARFF